MFFPQAEKVRAFFADALGLSSADAGGGWLISPFSQPSLLFIQLTVRAVISST